MVYKANNRIKIILAEQGRNNNWLAEALDVNRSTVSKWCTNLVQPGLQTLYDIAAALDVNVRELLVPTK